MSDQPVIGISSYSLRARWGSWDRPAVLLPRRYTDMVASAGALPGVCVSFVGDGKIV